MYKLYMIYKQPGAGNDFLHCNYKDQSLRTTYYRITVAYACM